MKLLIGVACLVLLMSVGVVAGAEKSCDDMMAAISSKLKKDAKALKVYKKVEDRTEFYAEGKARFSKDVSGLRRNLAMAAQMLSELPGGLDMLDLESRFALQTKKIILADIEDKSSEVVLLCVGRIRMSDGIRHFLLSVTKDDEGDSYWSAQLY